MTLSVPCLWQATKATSSELEAVSFVDEWARARGDAVGVADVDEKEIVLGLAVRLFELLAGSDVGSRVAVAGAAAV